MRLGWWTLTVPGLNSISGSLPLSEFAAFCHIRGGHLNSILNCFFFSLQKHNIFPYKIGNPMCRHSESSLAIFYQGEASSDLVWICCLKNASWMGLFSSLSRNYDTLWSTIPPPSHHFSIHPFKIITPLCLKSVLVRWSVPKTIGCKGKHLIYYSLTNMKSCDTSVSTQWIVLSCKSYKLSSCFSSDFGAVWASL